MDKQQLRQADFKTGVFLIAFCLWFLGITFAFMPFKQTYGGVENVWYVSPWIFPAVILTLLLLLSSILTINAILHRGLSDILILSDSRPRSFRLTRVGAGMIALLALASGAGLIYLVINIEEKIQTTIDEAKWLADPSQAELFSWNNPLAIIPLTVTGLVFIASAGLGASLLIRRHRLISPAADKDHQASRETFVRFAVIAILFAELVYLWVPNVDFFIGILLFLTVFTTCFYVDDLAIARLSMGAYIAIGVLLLLIFATNFDAVLNTPFEYATDLLALGLTLGYSGYVWRRLSTDHTASKKFRTCLLISWITPLLLVPVFRFGLLVPLPHEGAVIELMHHLRYLMR